MRFLFTADDAGASVEVNEAIRRACTDGHVNSVAFLVNLPDFDDAKERVAPAVRHKSVHLNLVEGRPLSLDTTSPLVDDDGWFAYQASGLLRAYYLGSPATRARIAADARQEIGAQMVAFHESFRGPMAVDSHQHVHMFPFVLPQLISAAHERDLTISRLRWPDEALALQERLTTGGVKATLLSQMGRHGRKRVPDDIPLTRAFCGVAHTGQMTLDVAQRFIEKVSGLPSEELAELLVHPGGGVSVTEAWARQSALRDFYTSPWRRRELELACSPELSELLLGTPGVFG